jgi:DNA-binding IclR family transcriptional regulator
MKQNYKDIYLFILTCLEKTGQVPTLQEIGDEFKFSRENARQIIQRMTKYGYLIPKKLNTRRYYPLYMSDLIEK